MKLASIEAILIARHKSASAAYRKAILIVLKTIGTRETHLYGSTFHPSLVHGRKKGPGFYITQEQYNG